MLIYRHSENLTLFKKTLETNFAMEPCRASECLDESGARIREIDAGDVSSSPGAKLSIRKLFANSPRSFANNFRIDVRREKALVHSGGKSI